MGRAAAGPDRWIRRWDASIGELAVLLRRGVLVRRRGGARAQHLAEQFRVGHADQAARVRLDRPHTTARSPGLAARTPPLAPTRTYGAWLDFWKQLLHHDRVARPVPPRHRYTYAEYLVYEQDSGLKHEYDNGEILAIAGGSRRHNALASRVSAALEQGRGSDCVAFQSDQKVRILATGKATYPDTTLVCGRIEGDRVDPLGATITNRRYWWRCCPLRRSKTIAATTSNTTVDSRAPRVVLVSQSEPRVERYRRLASGAWEYSDVTGGVVRLATGATLELENEKARRCRSRPRALRVGGNEDVLAPEVGG